MPAEFTPGQNVIGVPGPPGPEGPEGPAGDPGAHDHPEYAIVAHTHPEYSDVLHTHPGYALTGHDHNGTYSLLGHNHDGAYSALGHNHDSVYALIHSHPYASDTHNHDAAYSAISHDHSGVYAPVHGHPYADISHGMHVDLAESGDISTQAFGDSPAAGASSTEVAAADHKHGMPANPVTAHEAAGDPHSGYRLESADHSHASAGLQGGTITHAVTTGQTPNDHHNRDHAATHQPGGADVEPSINFSTAAQAITANTVTYLTGSGILIPAGGIVAGQVYRWYIGVTKTAAGTATPIWTPRIGTNQTTADGTVLTITGTAQVATASGTLIIVTCQVRSVGASGIIVGNINTGAASFGIGGNVVSGAFDTTGKAGQRFGLCVNTGASAAWTVNSVHGELVH